MPVSTPERENEEQFINLASEHRAIKERLRQLDRDLALTSAERVERAQLTRRQMQTAGRLLQLQQH